LKANDPRNGHPCNERGELVAVVGFRHGPQVFRIAKHLTREEAYRRAKKRATRDFRGFHYDPKTGIAKLI
jgi:hypothetical protein